MGTLKYFCLVCSSLCTSPWPGFFTGRCNPGRRRTERGGGWGGGGGGGVIRLSENAFRLCLKTGYFFKLLIFKSNFFQMEYFTYSFF